MRVTCNDVDAFLKDLSLADAEQVLQRAVRVSVSRNPVDGNRRDALKFTVTLQASAIIGLEDGGEYLLEVGVDCGNDYMDGRPDLGGTECADDMVDQIRHFCESRGLVVRPGIIEP